MRKETSYLYSIKMSSAFEENRDKVVSYVYQFQYCPGSVCWLVSPFDFGEEIMMY